VCRRFHREARRRYHRFREGLKRYDVTGFIIVDEWAGCNMYCAATLDYVLVMQLPAFFQIAEWDWQALLAEADRDEV
jgi:uncharacterized Fe-S cluster-containing radical SAM superfamily protein